MFRRLTSCASAAQQRTICTSAPRLGVAPYSLYLKKVYASPATRKLLSGMSVPQAGKTIAKWYRGLPEEHKLKLKYEAKRITAPKRKSKKPARTTPKRKPSAYNKFVAAQSKKMTHLPPSMRIKAIAKLWKKAKK